MPCRRRRPTARDAYVQASDLALTFYPGALEAYDRAIAADPGFAMAHAGKAQVLMRQGDVAAARAALAAAKDVVSGASEREASHIAFFELVFAGRTDAAIAALYPHLTAWPRDALVVASAANPNGLIGGSGRIGQKHQIAALMDSLAPHYGDDFWFGSYHAMALSEDGQLAAARAKIERSVAINPNNAHGAHGFAHVCYESGELEAGRSLPLVVARHLSARRLFPWPSQLASLAVRDPGRQLDGGVAALRDALALDRHSGGPQQKMSDGAAFLWRSELAGHPRDAAAWRALHDYANSALPRPGSGLADLHVILAQAVMGDESRARRARSPDRGVGARGRVTRPAPTFRHWRAASRRSSAGIFPARSRRWRRSRGKTNASAAAARQHDLIEFTLLKAYLNANRLEEARRSARRETAGRFRRSRRGRCGGALSAKLRPFATRSGRRPEPSM